MQATLEPLVEVLRTGSPEAQEAAAGAIANLTLGHDDNQLVVASAGAVEPLLRMLETGSSSIKEVSAAALQKLASVSRESKVAMLKALPLMLALVEDPLSTDFTMERMLGAISSMLGDELVVEAAVDAGAIRTMIGLLHRGSQKCKETAARCLAAIASVNEGFEASVGGGGATIPLVRMLESHHPEGKEAAAGALCAMSRTCSNNKSAIGKTKAIEVLIAIMEEVQGSQDPDALRLQVAVASTLANLALGHAENASNIAKKGAMMPLVALLEVGRPDQLEAVMQALVSMTAATQGALGTKLAKDLVELGAAKHLTRLLAQEATETHRMTQAAACLVQNLTVECQANVGILLGAGVVPLLLKHVAQDDPDVRETAAGALSNMSVESAEVVEAVATQPGAYLTLIKAVEDGTPLGRANAAGIILNMAYASTARSIELKDAGAVVALVGLLQDGDVHGKATAAGALQNFAFEREQNLMVVAEAIGLKMTAPYIMVVERLDVLKHSMCAVSSDSQEDSMDSD